MFIQVIKNRSEIYISKSKQFDYIVAVQTTSVTVSQWTNLSWLFILSNICALLSI